MLIEDRKTRRARMREITRTDRSDWAGMPSNYMSSADPRAVAYRRSLALASNAIEGVVLSDGDIISPLLVNKQGLTTLDGFESAIKLSEKPRVVQSAPY